MILKQWHFASSVKYEATSFFGKVKCQMQKARTLDMKAVKRYVQNSPTQLHFVHCPQHAAIVGRPF